MHILSAIVLILGAIIVLVLGLASVLHDLLERGPYDVPLIREESLSWPRRLQHAVLPRGSAATNLHIHHSGGAGSST